MCFRTHFGSSSISFWNLCVTHHLLNLNDVMSESIAEFRKRVRRLVSVTVRLTSQEINEIIRLVDITIDFCWAKAVAVLRRDPAGPCMLWYTNDGWSARTRSEVRVDAMEECCYARRIPLVDVLLRRVPLGGVASKINRDSCYVFLF